MRASLAVMAPVVLAGCSLQPSYRPTHVAPPPVWDVRGTGDETAPTMLQRNWWVDLGDPAVNRLIEAALVDNPTLGEATARVDRARAILASQKGYRSPYLGVEGSAAQSRTDASDSANWQTSAAVGLRLSWELDLWGRLRETARAAEYRLSARSADAEGVVLAIAGEIASTTVTLRECRLALVIRDEDISSREEELRITRSRLQLGAIAPYELATVMANLALARTERITQEENCRLQVNALVALTGKTPQDVRALVALEPEHSAGEVAQGSVEQAEIPAPPMFRPELPALVLVRHPAAVAAEREVAARWSEIAVSKAERLPRIDLGAVLTGQWLRAFGSSSTSLTGSAGAQLAGPLLDGGTGAANVRVAEADYRGAVSTRDYTVRTLIRDVEDGLAQQASAYARMETATEYLTSARYAMRANIARLNAGAIARYELEDSRRTLNQARLSALNASADRARSWVALVRRAGVDWDGAGADSVDLRRQPESANDEGGNGR